MPDPVFSLDTCVINTHPLSLMILLGTDTVLPRSFVLPSPPSWILMAPPPQLPTQMLIYNLEDQIDIPVQRPFFLLHPEMHAAHIQDSNVFTYKVPL